MSRTRPALAARPATFLILALLVLTLRVFAANAARVEQYYATGFYQWFSRLLRLMLGWLPISAGDLLYLTAALALLYGIYKFIKAAIRKQLALTGQSMIKAANGLLALYLLFLVFWGLNYYRQRAEARLQLPEPTYAAADLRMLLTTLAARLNYHAAVVDSVERNQYLNKSLLADSALAAYSRAAVVYPFLKIRQPSVKASLFSPLSRFFGFTGYFNPFTSEAQINTEVPVLYRPFILTHEIAHQLGYAREDEASFVAFLACLHSRNPDFLYSIYFELYRSAARQLVRSDPDFVKKLSQSLHPRVRADFEIMDKYLQRFANPVEAFITRIYDKFLKLNNQPKGMATYSHVVGSVVAYVKKHGTGALQ